jgi:hypothetical protein
LLISPTLKQGALGIPLLSGETRLTLVGKGAQPFPMIVGQV